MLPPLIFWLVFVFVIYAYLLIVLLCCLCCLFTLYRGVVYIEGVGGLGSGIGVGLVFYCGIGSCEFCNGLAGWLFVSLLIGMFMALASLGVVGV